MILLQAAGGDMLPTFILFGLMFVVMYFFFIRPQQKKMKEQNDFVAKLQKGDRVVTNAGIHGRILKEEGETFLVEVDTNVKLKIERSAISYDNTKRLNAETGKKEEVAATK
ncbi:MAG: preprotein translocase subunit YajC [Chitinophagales bacterium]|nr:preprotein translocase subunit YajC [Chitinophagales bacterium]